MSDYELPVTVSSVRHEFGTFFDRVRWLYNLAKMKHFNTKCKHPFVF